MHVQHILGDNGKNSFQLNQAKTRSGDVIYRAILADLDVGNMYNTSTKLTMVTKVLIHLSLLKQC